MKKIPYVLVLGDKEQQDGTVTVRAYKHESLNTLSLGQFIADIQQKINTKAFDIVTYLHYYNICNLHDTIYILLQIVDRLGGNL